MMLPLVLLCLVCSVQAASHRQTTGKTTAKQPLIRQCRCSEANDCKKTAMSNISSCFTTCDHIFKPWRVYSSENLVQCFEKNVDATSNAEECLFREMGDFCRNDTAVHMIPPSDFAALVGVELEMATPPDIVNDVPLLKRAVEQFQIFHEFHHCVKGCAHQQMSKCFKQKGCAVKLPDQSSMTEILERCNQYNPRITAGLYSTCQCLAFRKHIRSLYGICAVISNPAYAEYM